MPFSSRKNFAKIFAFQTTVDVFSSIFSTLLQPLQMLLRESFCSSFFQLSNYFTLSPSSWNYKVCSTPCSIRQVVQWTVNIRKVWIGNLIIVRNERCMPAMQLVSFCDRPISWVFIAASPHRHTWLHMLDSTFAFVCGCAPLILPL